MSKFTIYKSRNENLKEIGIFNRFFHKFFVTGLPVLAFLSVILRGLKTEMVFIIVIVLWVLSAFVLTFYFWHIKKNLQKLGEVEVTLNGIKKSIGGFDKWFDFGDISEISIEQHISSIFFPDNYDSSRTYLVTIKCKDQSEERFVVSSQSDGRPAVNFFDAFKYLEKINRTGFRIRKE